MFQLQLLIVGGGPAGMAAALIAGRARLRALVVNAEAPRNAIAHASHGFLTRDGAHASELLALAKAQLEPYTTVDYVVDKVAEVVRDDSGFVVTAASGARWRTRRVVFATGYRTDLAGLELPGLDEVYGRSVFPCPFCDGFEHADRALAVFSWNMASHLAPMVRLWSEDIVVFTHGNRLDDETLGSLRARGIRVERARIRRLEHKDGQLRAVLLDGGASIPREAGFLGEEHAVPTSSLPTELGVPRATHVWGMEHYDADDFGKTAVEGVYVIGDLKRVFGGITAAAHDGYTCAAGIVHEVAREG